MRQYGAGSTRWSTEIVAQRNNKGKRKAQWLGGAGNLTGALRVLGPGNGADGTMPLLLRVLARFQLGTSKAN